MALEDGLSLDKLTEEWTLFNQSQQVEIKRGGGFEILLKVGSSPVEVGVFLDDLISGQDIVYLDWVKVEKGKVIFGVIGQMYNLEGVLADFLGLDENRVEIEVIG